MKKTKEPQTMSFLDQGHFYGYPDCCIDEFLHYMLLYMKGISLNRGERKLSGTGYVPCKRCNEKTEKQLLATIKKNRKCHLPFPQQPR